MLNINPPSTGVVIVFLWAVVTVGGIKNLSVTPAPQFLKSAPDSGSVVPIEILLNAALIWDPSNSIPSAG